MKEKKLTVKEAKYSHRTADGIEVFEAKFKSNAIKVIDSKSPNDLGDRGTIGFRIYSTLQEQTEKKPCVGAMLLNRPYPIKGIDF